MVFHLFCNHKERKDRKPIQFKNNECFTFQSIWYVWIFYYFSFVSSFFFLLIYPVFFPMPHHIAITMNQLINMRIYARWFWYDVLILYGSWLYLIRCWIVFFFFFIVNPLFSSTSVRGKPKNYWQADRHSDNNNKFYCHF